MESQESIPLQYLSEEDAWNLFAKKARKSFEEGTEFYDVARMVARECAGLPIALIAVARVLGDKGLEDWKAAAVRLKAAQPANYEDKGDVLKCIKLSYDYLRSDEERSFFLLCCLFPEDYDIPVEGLFMYAIGKGLFQDACTIIEARDRAHSVANYIKASSLLMDSEYKGCVRMHDVIRDVAISISLLEDDSRFFVKAGRGLRHWPRIKAHEGYSAISLMRNEIYKLPKEPVCPELRILLLQCNLIDEIPKTFFPSPNKLRVLDLSGTSVSSLPSSVSLLTNLQALYLDDCKRIVDISILGNLKNLQILSMKNLQIINKRGVRCKEMPKEIGRLASLKMLDVTDACFQTVPSNVISNLDELEELYMTCDFCDWGGSNRLELGPIFFAVGKNASFDELTGLSRLNSLKVHIGDAKCLPQSVRNNPNWVNFNICISNKDFLSRSYYRRFLERKLTDKLDPRCFRYVTLNTSIKFIPHWFINVVMEKAEMLEYIGYNSLSNILEEYDRGRLYSLKYLAISDCGVQGMLMYSRIRNEAVFESLEELYLEEVYQLVGGIMRW
ncbi:hypothetical protein M0R45_035553 [Rubus argutus]|uniref:NB-ARC domain-containing protein n=1 Tax=Rubus argutus TaxID=59490 RepID=A0AAW1VUC8_RUBAR